MIKPYRYIKPVSYKDYSIQSRPCKHTHLKKGEKKWMVRIHISYRDGNVEFIAEFLKQTGFYMTQREADAEGIAYGRRIIDALNSGLPIS